MGVPVVSGARVGARAGARDRSARIPFWDTARWMTMALVVVGHVLEVGRGQPVVGAAYLLLYAFHMPLFAFLSGRFSTATPTRHHLVATVTGVAVPYVVFSGAWGLLRVLVEGEGASVDLADPYWVMWFLLALFVWRALLPLVAVLRRPVLVSAVVGVGAPYMGAVGAEYDSARILGLLPFFVLGWASRERGWHPPAPTAATRLAAAAVLAAGALAAWVVLVPLGVQQPWAWTYYDAGYADLGAPQWWAGGVRLVLMAAALVLAASFLALVPRRPSRMSAWGTATLYVYVLHGLPIYLARQLAPLPAGGLPLWVWGMLALGGVGLAAALASAPVRALARPLVEPGTAWLVRGDPPVDGGAVNGAGGPAETTRGRRAR